MLNTLSFSAQINMDKQKLFETSYQEAKDYCVIWGSEREDVMKELKAIKDEMQQLSRNRSKGSIAYSTTRLLGGGLVIAGAAAPFTFGASLALIATGSFAGVTSAVMDFSHGKYKSDKIKRLLKKATFLVTKHVETHKRMMMLLNTTESNLFEYRQCLNVSDQGYCKTVTESEEALALFKPFVRFIKSSRACYIYHKTGSQEEATKVMNPEEALGDFIPTYLIDTSTYGKTEISKDGLTALAAVVLITRNITTIISESNELNSDELCDEAQNIQDIIEKMKWEYDIIKGRFD